MDSSWQYDETIQVGTDYRDQNEVRAYDERMQKLRQVDAEAKEVQRALAVSPDSVVWEIGTGTGECALALAGVAKEVYASDVSLAMLEYAQGKATRRGITNVIFAEGGFLSGFRPDHPVDGIVTQLALHHLPDFWKSRALATIADNLRPNGKLYLRDVVFPSTTVDDDAYFLAAIERTRSRAGDEVAGQLARHIRKEYSTLDWILEGMIPRSGLKIVEKQSEGLLWVYVCEKTPGSRL